MGKTGLARKLLNLSSPEGLLELSRLNGLVLTGPDPGANDVGVPALFEASKELVESIGLNVRLIGCYPRIAASGRKQRSKGIFQAQCSRTANLGHIAIAKRCINDVV
jgi:hypothetical protein